jgi:hypothetical protein
VFRLKLLATALFPKPENCVKRAKQAPDGQRIEEIGTVTVQKPKWKVCTIEMVL